MPGMWKSMITISQRSSQGAASPTVAAVRTGDLPASARDRIPGLDELPNYRRLRRARPVDLEHVAGEGGEDADLIRSLSRSMTKLSGIEQVEKIYLNNTNQLYAFTMMPPKIGTIRETFFLCMLQAQHRVTAPKHGDFSVNNKFIFEVGGKNKSFEQIKNQSNSYLALDNIETGIDRKIPLWLFGFLY